MCLLWCGEVVCSPGIVRGGLDVCVAALCMLTFNVLIISCIDCEVCSIYMTQKLEHGKKVSRCSFGKAEIDGRAWLL
jgi:hypothetical protein